MLKTRLNTKTRLETIMHTAKKLVDIGVKHSNSDGEWWDENLPLAIEARLIHKLEVAVSDSKHTFASATLHINWDDHDRCCVSIGETINFDDIKEGDLFTSIENALKAIDRYIGDSKRKHSSAADVSIWFWYNPKKIQEYGRARIKKIMNVDWETSREDIDKLEQFHSLSMHRKHNLSDLNECNFILRGLK